MKVTTLLSAGLVVATMTASVAVAGITERLQSDRMTVLNVDRMSGRFQCVEHRTWTPVAKDSPGRYFPRGYRQGGEGRRSARSPVSRSHRGRGVVEPGAVIRGGQ